MQPQNSTPCRARSSRFGVDNYQEKHQENEMAGSVNMPGRANIDMLYM